MTLFSKFEVLMLYYSKVAPALFKIVFKVFFGLKVLAFFGCGSSFLQTSLVEYKHSQLSGAGGYTVDHRQFPPHAVRIFFEKESCSGSYLGNGYIISSAHCLLSKDYSNQLRLKEVSRIYYLTNQPYGAVRQVYIKSNMIAQIIINPFYLLAQKSNTSGHINGDLALIKLKDNLHYRVAGKAVLPDYNDQHYSPVSIHKLDDSFIEYNNFYRFVASGTNSLYAENFWFYGFNVVNANIMVRDQLYSFGSAKLDSFYNHKNIKQYFYNSNHNQNLYDRLYFSTDDNDNSVDSSISLSGVCLGDSGGAVIHSNSYSEKSKIVGIITGIVLKNNDKWEDSPHARKCAKTWYITSIYPHLKWIKQYADGYFGSVLDL